MTPIDADALVISAALDSSIVLDANAAREIGAIGDARRRRAAAHL
jgi:hypothetical protein